MRIVILEWKNGPSVNTSQLVRQSLATEAAPTGRMRGALFGAAGALVIFGLVAFLLVLSGVPDSQGLASFDEPVRAWLVENRTESLTFALTVVAEVTGPIGMPIFVGVFCVVWIWRSRQPWGPLVLAFAMITGMSLALSIASLVGRPRPPAELMLLVVDPSFSFPSGHVLGVSDFILVTGFLVCSRNWSWPRGVVTVVVAIVGIGLVALSRLYLGYHWLTDVTASVSLSLCVLGLAIALDTWRPFGGRGSPAVRGEQTVAQGGPPAS